ncbi:MAG: hypothetical protein ACD_17C00091G0002 [uncultured bacterium]|nr:MAG: hypothetical protein ACD_17C00091G0002 [uncultured bacterium]OGN55408.1 MAG: hypothetical protein A2796_02635 [Chlamydiae bacterium RIFCSPHIGHO2_01_FULL_44_39]OGN56807.1 MAG: hypothetical protein A3C42_02325 [Chlamydiae bacterium RIFCSPHIGHO2_02_FULL_45_9]OGN59912.1 MAG: hypothetical protein A3D96_03950 [Chlamydiae bacterium RIFCSPHIGHO2_12_FULL_44_59]OGN66119.1 MAG: hypothetical protein A2978_04465 [Chlamydiae bacterium RIFCSPLOWO2_01_FULL_44_52]OGN68654.1 MAG: hypothetical protein A3
MSTITYCGPMAAIPHHIKAEFLKKIVSVHDPEATVFAMKQEISKATEIPMDHLKLYKEDMTPLNDHDQPGASLLYYTIIRCKNPQHCPMQLKLKTMSGQMLAPFTEKTTVRELKEYIAQSLSMREEALKLQFDGKSLKDGNQMLSHLGIADDAEIVLSGAHGPYNM